MPPYIVRIRGKNIRIDAPGLMGAGEFGRIRKRIAAEIDQGEDRGRVKFRSKVAGEVNVRWGPSSAKRRKKG